MIRLRSSLVAAAALAIAIAAPAAAQTPTALQVLHDASHRARTRAEGVQNYTLNLKTMGQGVVSYVSRDAGGAFHAQSGGVGDMGKAAAQMTGWADELLFIMQEIPDNDEQVPADVGSLSYDGVSGASGAAAHVVTMRFGPGSAPDAGGMQARRISFHLDTATLVIRRMEIEMATSTGTPGTMLMEFGDWRPLMGMQLPYRRHLVMRGLRAEVLGPDTATAMQAITQGRAELAGIPAAQRDGMRQMLEVMEGLVERDEMVVDEIVTSVAVNQGPPAGVDLSGLDSDQQ